MLGMHVVIGELLVEQPADPVRRQIRPLIAAGHLRQRPAQRHQPVGGEDAVIVQADEPVFAQPVGVGLGQAEQRAPFRLFRPQPARARL
jgi:hypothetical protein